MEITQVDPYSLKNHPTNIEIYGDVADDDFVDSCRKGILEPVIATGDDVIVSGHRRVQASRILQHKTVPVLYRADLVDPLDIEETLLLANKQREKTNEQKTREYRRLLDIEKQRAAIRQKSGTPAPEGDKGRADERAAASAGMNVKTARKASKVMDVIEAATESGDPDAAKKLSDTLNKNVAKAHREVTKKDTPKPEGVGIPAALDPTFDSLPVFQSLATKVGNLKSEIADLSDCEGGERIHLPEVDIYLNDVASHLKAARPHTVCPYCGGNGCAECDELGWVHQNRYDGFPKEIKGA